ncbi:uncharacterized protein LOC113292622 [Papaver somniferum]|uniref:uncharacterized protein LOC113292622 n=1 Tax=Papaver somniferum TaxID=3469 RepID=UPI000E6F48F4|nr:uncharacterized protein LOC113292622 [Papaver somniferum]
MGGKTTSDIWKHFTKKNVQENDCNYCNKTIKDHTGMNGTSGMWKHFNRCKKNPNKPKPKGQKTLTLKPATLGEEEDEKDKFKNYFKSSKQRASLKTDTWTSPNNFNYICVTVHFIDQHLKLENRIIIFCEVSGHKGIYIGEMLEKCLSDWGLKDVFSVTLDNASANKVENDYLTTSIVSMTRLEKISKYLHVSI